MENSYFIFSDQEVHLDKLHICAWEFGNATSLVEFGFEIKSQPLRKLHNVSLGLYIPWLDSDLSPIDLYKNLRDSHNSKFIFNDSIKSTDSLDDGSNNMGVVQHFAGRDELAILPITFNDSNTKDKILLINVDLSFFNRREFVKVPNIYIRFYLEPKIDLVSTRKRGIGKSTIIYDTKINVLRNLPASLQGKTLCDVYSCFSFNIIPNSYDVISFDSESLKNVRNLEYNSFKRYLPDKRVKDKELIVIFNKKKGESLKTNDFNFFVVFKKERIGAGQFVLALLINLLCGVLLTFPSFRQTVPVGQSLIANLPPEFWVAIGIELLTAGYFLWPYLNSL